MKMKNAFLLFAIALLLIVGCSKASIGNNDSYYETPVIPFIDMAYTSSNATAGLGYDTELQSNRSRVASDDDFIIIAEESQEQINADMTSSEEIERKLVKRANIRIRVESFESTDAVISDLMKKYGAYSASTEIDENSRHYSLRVPSNRFDTFLEEMDGLGKILRRNETTEDVTVNYYDLEGRLATRKKLLETYQAYLGKAGNITEILSVEARIAELQYEIDRTGTQLRNLTNLIEYATIDLTLSLPAASTSYQRTTFGERLSGLFRNFGGFLSVLGVIITGIIIFGIPILILLIFFYWILFGRIGLVKKLWQVVNKKQE